MHFTVVIFLQSKVFNTLSYLTFSVTPQIGHRPKSFNEVHGALPPGPHPHHLNILSHLLSNPALSSTEHVPGPQSCQQGCLCPFTLWGFTPLPSVWSNSGNFSHLVATGLLDHSPHTDHSYADTDRTRFSLTHSCVSTTQHSAGHTLSTRNINEFIF